MPPIDTNTATAIDIIKRSALMHPSFFADHLALCLSNDLGYAAGHTNEAVRRSVQASARAYQRAIDALQADDVDRLTTDMGAGVVALNVACKLQCLPPHVRTAAALRTWPSA